MDQDSLEQHTASRPYMDVAERLLAAMDKKKIKGSTLALLLREGPDDTLTPQAVSNWTTGKGLPDAHRIRKILEILEISWTDLLGEHDLPKPGRKTKELYGIARRAKAPINDSYHAMSARAEAIKKLTELDEDTIQRNYGLEDFSMRSFEQAVTVETDKQLRARADEWVEERRSRAEIRSAITLMAHMRCREKDHSLVVDELRNISGSYFRKPMDIVISQEIEGTNILRAGVVIKSGPSYSLLSELVGEAMNWKSATNGLPLIVVWIYTPRQSVESQISNITEGLLPLTAPVPMFNIPLIDSYHLVNSDKTGLDLAQASDALKKLIFSL
jgi:transcriptional regulator with XRE-family HTH domain